MGKKLDASISIMELRIFRLSPSAQAFVLASAA
jgi:hypothetical protein